MNLILLNLFTQYWASILVVVIFVIIAAVLWTRGYKKEVKKTIYDLIVVAEEQLGSGTGEMKKNRVKRWIYERAPWIVKLFISYDTFDDLIDSTATKLKQFFEDGGDLLTYSENVEIRKQYEKVY